MLGLPEEPHLQREVGTKFNYVRKVGREREERERSGISDMKHMTVLSIKFGVRENSKESQIFVCEI